MLVFLIADIFGWEIAFPILLLFLSVLVFCLNAYKYLNALEEFEEAIERCKRDVFEFKENRDKYYEQNEN